MLTCERTYKNTMLEYIRKLKDLLAGQGSTSQLGTTSQQGTTQNTSKGLNSQQELEQLIEKVIERHEERQKLKSNVGGNKILTIVISIFTAAVIGIGGYVFITNNNDVRQLVVATAEIKKDIDAMQGDIDDLKADNSTQTVDINNIKKSIIALGGPDPDQYKTARNVKFYSDYDAPVSLIYEGHQDVRMSSPQLVNTGYIAQDVDTGEEYSAEDLVSQSFFYSYQKDGQDVLFCGQYNEDMQWDGECLTNIYQDGNLILVYEANYDSGQLISYRTVCQDTTNRDVDVWVVIERTCHDDINSGENWNYIRNAEYPADIDFSSAELDDLMDIDEAKEIVTRFPIEGHYYGNTSKGFYNDNTDDAYLIKYFENGTIRTLYHGRFAGGEFDDSTGNAWYISKKEIDGDYYFYLGKFKKGDTVGKSLDDFVRLLTKEEIENVLLEQNFPEKTGISLDELNWAFAKEG